MSMVHSGARRRVTVMVIALRPASSFFAPAALTRECSSSCPLSRKLLFFCLCYCTVFLLYRILQTTNPSFFFSTKFDFRTYSLPVYTTLNTPFFFFPALSCTTYFYFLSKHGSFSLLCLILVPHSYFFLVFCTFCSAQFTVYNFLQFVENSEKSFCTTVF